MNRKTLSFNLFFSHFLSEMAGLLVLSSEVIYHSIKLCHVNYVSDYVIFALFYSCFSPEEEH